jgi:hypothetical protein
MPSPIDALQQGLNASVQRLTPTNFSLPDDGIKAIQKTVISLRKQLGDRLVSPTQDRICSALKTLRTQGARGLDGMSFYFACWGLTQRCAGHSPLIEDGKSFADFMGEIEHRKPASLMWLGLLDTYFRYDPETSPAGKANWQRLRAWLENDLDNLLRRTNPNLRDCLAWLKTLERERGLLNASNQVKPYAAEALQGKQERLDRIKTDLDIPPTSWFWRELVLARIREAVTLSDDQFKADLPQMIPLLKDHKLLWDEGLKHLLTRYQACQDHATHEDLKALALEAWQSPQISSHGKWGHVAPTVKEMVSQWLVLEDLQDFFELLAADKAADPRRLRFWARYIKQISFSHIALGSHLWYSHDRDWVEFKQKKKGRISRLDGGGGSKNAFIMKIGAYYFVEFGETGDACYGYPENNVPFTLGRGYFDYPGNLRDMRKKVFRGIHRDGLVRWEQKFVDGSDTNQGLRDLGINTANEAVIPRPARTAQTPARPAALDLQRDIPVFTGQTNELPRPAALDSIRTEDRRRSGGALWVFHLEANGVIADYLKSQGYRFSESKGWWKK